MYSEIWNWEKCKRKIKTLRGRLGFPDAPVLELLKLSISLKDGRIYDHLKERFWSDIAPSIYCILSGYADAQGRTETHQLISFSQLWGGRSYQTAFAHRAIRPIERTFGSKVSMLHQAAKLLGGKKLNYGDCSVKLYALPLVPIVVILWTETPEFPASANILFDSSANSYLSTEQLVMLGELTSMRLRHAYEMLRAKA
jgi:hypothetical protein